MPHNHYSAVTASRIISALRIGQMDKQALCKALSCEYTHVNPTMAELLRNGKVIILGTRGEAGEEDHRRKAAPVYGLPGMQLQKIDRRKTERKGSGVIAGPVTIPSYVWGASRL